MKKRALRRHQQRVAKVRHVRIVWWFANPWHWTTSPLNVSGEAGWSRRPWQHVARSTMRGEPKHWQYAFNIRPSRTRQSRLLHDLERGLDPEAIKRWPDYRKPHIYYW